MDRDHKTARDATTAANQPGYTATEKAAYMMGFVDGREGFISLSELVEAMEKERKQHALLDGGSEQEKYWDDGFKTAKDFVKNWGPGK